MKRQAISDLNTTINNVNTTINNVNTTKKYANDKYKEKERQKTLLRVSLLSVLTVSKKTANALTIGVLSV